MVVFRMRAFIAICFLLTAFTMLNFNAVKAEYQPVCTLKASAFIKCLPMYEDVDFQYLLNVAAEAKSPTNMMSWSNGQRQQWVEKLRTGCGPFNEVGVCTEGYGGRRWWRCVEDDGMLDLVDQMGDAGGDFIPAEEPAKIRMLFDAVQDLCEPSLATDFDNHHTPCMKAVFKGQDRETKKFVDQVKAVDEQVARNCVYFNCESATAYNNAFVYPVKAKCPEAKVHETAHGLINPYLRTIMMTSEKKIYCSPNEFSRNVGSYTSEPKANVLNLMPKNTTTKCDDPTTRKTTTTTTPPPTTPKTTTKKPKATTKKPQATTKKPKRTTKKPQTTTKKPQPTTKKPQTTTEKPKPSTTSTATTTTAETTRPTKPAVDDMGFRVLKEELEDYYFVFYDITDSACCTTKASWVMILSLVVYISFTSWF